MGSSGGSSGGTTTSGGGTHIIRYADYIESAHQRFLNDTYSARRSATSGNPYRDFSNVRVDEGFFGAGHIIASFPALYDIYGKFAAGMDIEALWRQVLRESTNVGEVNQLVSAESALLQDELDSVVMPKFLAGMRDLNACMSSTFVIGRGLLLDSKQKNVAKFSAELKYKLVVMAQDRWKAHLMWNMEVINTYAKVIGLYFDAKDSVTRLNFEMHARRVAWPMEMLDHERANLGALQGATKSTSTYTSGAAGGPSRGAGMVGGAISGAAAGYMVGGPWGAAVGGVLGGLASLL